MSRGSGVLIVLCTLLSFSTLSGAQEAQQPVREILGLSEGISSLRQYQEQHRELLGLSPKRTEEEILELTLKQASQREEKSERKGEYIYFRPLFKHPAEIEKRRWARTRDIIQRVVPGVVEDPVFLERLARHAASIEIVLQELPGLPNKQVSALLKRVFLGTIPSLHWEASTLRESGYSWVVLSHGLLSFLHQVAKSVVGSWKEVEPQPGSKFGLSPAPKDVEYVLSQNPYTQELLYQTLSTWLFQGSLLTVDYEPPSPQYVQHPARVQAREMLRDLAERFVIAHEYGHAVVDKLASIKYCDSASWAKEYAADTSGFVLGVKVAAEFDQLPPNVALQGGIFVLSAYDVLHKAIDIVSCGGLQEDKGTETHPPLQQRIELLKQLYYKEVGIDGKRHMPIEGKSGQSKTIDLGIEGALVPSNTLSLLWNHIQPRFLEAHRGRRTLHSIWDGMSRDCWKSHP